MAPFDLLLYVALAAGFIGGRLVPVRPRWTEAATIASILVLVALLGASLGPLAPGELAATVPVALLLVVLLLAATIGVAALFAERPRRSVATTPERSTGRWLSPVLIAVILGGYVVGRETGASYDPGISYSLYVLVGLVAFGVRWSVQGIRRVWVPVTAAAAGALIAAAILTISGLLPPTVAFASSLGFGWYTLTGAVVAANAGAAFGFLAFLTNFLRENLTMVTSPWAGPTLGGESLTAMGGATSMDTTLYFITRYGDRDGANVALLAGLILTVAASALVPLASGAL